MSEPAASPPPPAALIAVSLLAASTLGLQVALTRHFSFLYWHHFAFMIIGIGMLGFGAAGAWLARRGGVADGAEGCAYAARAALASVGAVALYLLVGPAVTFAPLQLLRDPRQFFVLLALYAMILAPFTALGLAQGAILAGYRASAHRVYAADLVGAGLGCLLTLGLLSVVSAPASLLVWAAVAALAAGLLALGGSGRVRLLGWGAAGVAVLVTTQGWAGARPFMPAPSKDARTLWFDANGLRRDRDQVEFMTSSATIRLDVSYANEGPFMFGGNVAVPREEMTVVRRVIFQDGAAPTGFASVADPERTRFLGLTNQSLAYQIRERPRVCIIGAGGGPDVMIALRHGAREVTAVELNPQMLALGMERYPEFINGLYHRANVRPVVAEGRHFLGRTQETFDVVQMSGVDTFAALASGAYAMSENYLYTVEAGLAVLRALEPDGLFTNSRWFLDPPRETLRLVNVLAEALRRDGAAHPAAHLLVMKADTWATTLVSRRPFTARELDTLRAWTAARGWTIVLDPNGSGTEPFVTAIHAPPAVSARYREAYPYNIDAITDDNPFFFQFYKWRNLWRGPATRGGYLITAIPVGYAVLAASLVQMALLSGVCILGPLAARRSDLRGQPHLARRFALFGALGVGFMTVEITSIQAFTVFLGQPIYSMAITLASLLVATGLGSAWAGQRRATPATIVGSAIVAITVWVLLTVLLLKPVLAIAVGWPLLSRGLLVAGWLVPAGLALGMPFPTAIRALQAETPALVPWAWSANACASVLTSLGAVLVAMQLGFRVTLLLAVVLYWVGFLAWRRTVAPVAAGDAPAQT